MLVHTIKGPSKIADETHLIIGFRVLVYFIYITGWYVDA